jgi:hypothetical protein
MEHQAVEPPDTDTEPTERVPVDGVFDEGADDLTRPRAKQPERQTEKLKLQRLFRHMRRQGVIGIGQWGKLERHGTTPLRLRC